MTFCRFWKGFETFEQVSERFSRLIFVFFAEDISIYITHCVICRLINLFNITLILLMGGRLVPDDDDDVTDYVFTKYRSTEFNHFPISHFPNLILIFLKTRPTKTISQNKEIFITGLSQGRLGKNPWTLYSIGDQFRNYGPWPTEGLQPSISIEDCI